MKTTSGWSAGNRRETAIERAGTRILPYCYYVRKCIATLFLIAFSFGGSQAQVDLGQYEGRLIQSVEVAFEGSPQDLPAQTEFLAIIRIPPNTGFSAERVRDSLQTLFDSERVADARVEAVEIGEPGTGPLQLRYIIRREIQISDIRLAIGPFVGSPISEDELRARLHLTQPGVRLSQQVVNRNADEIQIYLRDRGYFNSVIETTQEIDASGTSAIVTYRITPGEQSRVGNFEIKVTGFPSDSVRPKLRLQAGAPFTREALGEDINTIRRTIIDMGYRTPLLDDPSVVRDPDLNQVSITLTGAIGPRVDVEIRNYEISERTQRELLPVLREGTIDPSAIEEGARRLRNRLQEDGYFFAEINVVCTITPPLPVIPANGTEGTCEYLAPEALTGREVRIIYDVERGRRFRLTDIRITGTDKISIADVEADLRTRRATALALIPFFGYGRGYTSLTLLEQDRRTIRAYMQDLGYRRTEVEVLQGVSIDGENLIITFNVVEGPLTRIASVDVRGNQIFTEQRIRNELMTVVGGPYSRTQARIDGERVLALYARHGYINPQLDFSLVELPANGEEEHVRLIYTITNEGDKVFINRIIVNGVTGDLETQRTKRDAIVRAIHLDEGEILRADLITESERELYLTDAYRQVIIRTEPAGQTPGGFQRRDVIIDVEEKAPRVLDYGGGYSTDTGALGLVELSHVNLMNKLRQGAMRLRASQRKQILRFEYLDPRFARYSREQFAPLGISVEYTRDSTVTRFFRSAIDRGTFGIVQRLDEDRNPIDQFGMRVSEPTINRFTVAVESQRILNRDTRTILFGRYSYEDVRLFNLQSLLIAPVLQPDRAVRLSRLGVSLVRDTRERCERGLLGLTGRRTSDDIEPGARGEVCRYNQVDPTRGDFFTVDYAVALRQLGGNLSFNRFQTNYRRYYKAGWLRDTVFAGNLTLGLANLFNPRDRDGSGTIDEIDLTLPISERFFSGGSTTLRGFAFEEAGPRQVIIPEGDFRDQQGDVVALNPFTVPVGGNALAILNLEARIPFTNSFQAVPFYDGGNVFRRVGDLFRKRDDTPEPSNDLLASINRANLRARWTHTVGLGFRIRIPLGGALAIDYGFLLNPPEFLIPQRGPGGNFDADPAIYRLKRTHLHFRITQTF